MLKDRYSSVTIVYNSSIKNTNIRLTSNETMRDNWKTHVGKLGYAKTPKLNHLRSS